MLLELNECLQQGTRDTYLEEYLNAIEDLIGIRAQAVNYEE